MGRPSTVRYREDRDAWVTTIGGTYHTLAHGKRNRSAAMRRFHELQSTKRNVARTDGAISVAELFDRFLKWTSENREPLTLEFYRRHLSQFADEVGRATACGDVRAFHVTEWLSGRPLGQSTRHGAITAVKRCFRWGTKQGYLEVNRLDGLDRPGIPRRETILSPENEVHAIDSASGPLREYLVMLRETGCRPSEVARMEAAHVDLETGQGVVVMPGKTTRRTGKSRVIYLSETAKNLVLLKMASGRRGPLFRNNRGLPWTRHALAHAMKRLRDKIKLGKECTAESFRHGWVTDAKLKLPNSVVAELAGHTSTAMVDKHYGHLSERKSHLAEAAALVRGTEERTSTASELEP